MTSIPTLETERLTLRPPELADFPTYASFYADAVGSGDYGGPLRADQAFGVLCKDMGHWVFKGFGKWSIMRRADNTMLGGCGLVHPEGWPSHELTWWLHPDFRGQGIASEASRAVIEFAFKTLKWPAVETHMQDENSAARKLVESLGGQICRRDAFPDGISRNIFAFSKIVNAEAMQ
ncbi:MAG: GNAT family N-acetyltransferase [Rhodobacteraceae bacterium]|nr:GNAT family N-acetyltransferase [Paracoccaceae bacterium]